MVKKLVVTVNKFKNYIDEIQQSYELGFTHYRLYKNEDGVFITPIRVYDGRVYMYWTMLPPCRLAIDILQRIQ